MKLYQIISTVTHRLTKDLVLVFTGNIFSASLGFFAVLIISRELTVSDFGVFNTAIPFILIPTQLSSLGMDTVMTKFASSFLSKEKEGEAIQVIRVTLIIRVIMGSVYALIIFNTADLFSLMFFQDYSLSPIIKLCTFGIFFAAIFNCFKSILYIYQLFKQSTSIQILVDLGKLSIVVLLMFSLKLDIRNAVTTFAFAPLIGVLYGVWMLRKILFSKGSPVQNLLHRLFSYSKWLVITNICVLVLPYIGIFMVAKMLSREAAGVYGLAVNLTYIFPIIIYSLRSVLLPEVSRFKEPDQIKIYIKNSLRISFYVVLVISPFLIFANKIIPFFFGVRYIESVPIFNCLLLSYMVVTINTTIRVVIYSINKPHVLAIADLIRLIFLLLGSYLLIPFLNVLAPAVIVIIVNVGYCVFISLYIHRKIRSGDMSFECSEIVEPVSS